MAASHPEMFLISSVNEADLILLVEYGLLALQVVLQWRIAYGEEILTPNTQEILVMKLHFQRAFGLPTCNFFRGLLDHYKIELVHLNPNSIFEIAISVHLYEVFLGIPPHFAIFRHYFFLKYEPNATNRQVIGGVNIQTQPCRYYLPMLLKTSLKAWHKQWFYYKNHDPKLPEFDDAWTEEPTNEEMPDVALVVKINFLKGLG
jgi:hypothetical protein